MDKVYIIEANSLIYGGKRAQYHIFGLENALAEYDDCKNDGELPEKVRQYQDLRDAGF